MAKRSSEPAPSDKAKVRVFFAEVEGNNESVQEALRTMVSAMTRPVRVVAEQRLNGKAPSLLQQSDAEDIENAVDQAEQVEEDSVEDSAAAVVRKPRGTGKKVDRNAGLELVPDLNFRPGGQQTFKGFVGDKKPKNDREVALAAIYYMQKIMGLTKIGARHVMTAFKEAGIAIPVDVRQTIRNVKNTSARLSFTDMEDIRTTTQGENFVEHDMGKTD